MWWSGPSSWRFIPGGCSDKHPAGHPPSGHYENAPLIPSAERDAEGRSLDYPEGMSIQLFRDAAEAGIDVVIYDCFSDGAGDFIALFRVAEAARLSGTGVTITPCIDRMPNDGLDFLKHLWLFRDPDSGKLLREHPNLLRVNGVPVAFEYHKAAPEVWNERFARVKAVGGNCFVVAHGSDGINSAVRGRLSERVREHIAFAPAAYIFGSNSVAFGAPDPIEDLLKMARSFDPPKAVGGAAGPGYIGTTRVGNVLDPRGTRLYRQQWVNKIKLNPDLVQLPTGNDYSEATEQECSVNSTFTFIDLTRYFGTRWRTGQWPELNRPQAFLSYRSTVSLGERAEFELVLLRPDITGDESADQIARRFTAICRVHTSDGQMIDLPPVVPQAELGQIVWRFWNEQGFTAAGWGRPQVRIEADGQTVALPDGPAAAFGIMNQGEELARKWLRVPLHRIRDGIQAQVRVSGSPDNLYPRTVRVEGLPWEDVAGGTLMRNGITSLWYTLPPDVLRDGFVERFYGGPGFACMHYQDGWKKRRVIDQQDRYTAVVRFRDGTLAYPQPAVLAAPHVDPATALDLMIPPPLEQLGPPLSDSLVKQWKPSEDLLVDRGPLGHDVALPPASDPARPAILRDAPEGPWYLRFDGQDDQLKTGVLTMPPGPVTVDLLVRFRATGRSQVIFDQWGDALGIGLTSQGRLVVVRVNQRRKMDWLEGEQRLEPEKWYRIAATFNGRELQLYVNGKPDGQPVASHGLRTDENTVIGGQIGMLVELAGIHERIKGFFAGDLARVRVLQRAMDEAEVESMHTGE
jgi:hypothetical protein